MNIKTRRYGFAYRHNDTIWVNENLPQYPRLYAEVIKHEEEHQPGDYCLKDLLHDTKIASIDKMLFIFSYPSTWTLFIPIWREEEKWVYDPSTIILYLILLITGGLIIWAKY